VTRLFSWMVLGVTAFAPAAFADIADYMLNVNGTTYCPGGGEAGVPGLCSSTGGLGASGATGTLDTVFPGGTGLGTETLVYNPGPGTYYVNLWLFENVDLSNPFNEYGASSGSPATGETWQIDVPDADYAGELGTAGAGTIVSNTAGNTLSDTNYVPGQMSNSDLSSCGFFTSPGTPVADCNDATSMALGFGFTLGSSEEELVSFTVSHTPPASGLYLSTTDPISLTTDYFYGSATTQSTSTPPPPPPTIPEPGSWILLTTVAGILGLIWRRRLAVQ
jgi:hypothetical protein